MSKSVKKIIIKCPSCGHKVRVPKNINLTYNCPNCRYQASHDGKRKRKPHYIIFLVLILVVSYFVFFKDYFAYQNVKEERTEAACNEYYNTYPNGFFIEEVHFIEIDVTKDINVVRSFLKSYPSSEKTAEVLKINKDLWDYEINRYNEIVETKGGLDPKAVRFFRSLLNYMRDNNKATIALTLVGNVDVKNFEKYNPDIKSRLDSILYENDKRNVSGNIIEIETNYYQGYLKKYENIVKGSVENGFENILSHNFITVVPTRTANDSLAILIKYDIKNQEREEYPVIWSYESEKEFISYLIGVSINYSFEMKVPEGDENFDFDYKTNALDNINNVRSIEEGYQRMTAQNFYNFSKIISAKFGLYEEEDNKEEVLKEDN